MLQTLSAQITTHFTQSCSIGGHVGRGSDALITLDSFWRQCAILRLRHHNENQKWLDSGGELHKCCTQNICLFQALLLHSPIHGQELFTISLSSFWEWLVPTWEMKSVWLNTHGPAESSVCAESLQTAGWCHKTTNEKSPTLVSLAALRTHIVPRHFVDRGCRLIDAPDGSGFSSRPVIDCNPGPDLCSPVSHGTRWPLTVCSKSRWDE